VKFCRENHLVEVLVEEGGHHVYFEANERSRAKGRAPSATGVVEELKEALRPSVKGHVVDYAISKSMKDLDKKRLLRNVETLRKAKQLHPGFSFKPTEIQDALPRNQQESRKSAPRRRSTPSALGRRNQSQYFRLGVPKRSLTNRQTSQKYKTSPAIRHAEVKSHSKEHYL
jgi:hypothetical protein